jgi:hypothetical protein
MKIYAVFRRFARGMFGSADFHFYKAFASKADAKAFCDKKNANAGCSYVYGVKSISVIHDSSKEYKA